MSHSFPTRRSSDLRVLSRRALFGLIGDAKRADIIHRVIVANKLKRVGDALDKVGGFDERGHDAGSPDNMATLSCFCARLNPCHRGEIMCVYVLHHDTPDQSPDGAGECNPIVEHSAQTSLNDFYPA